LQEGCAAVKAEADTPIFDTSLIFLANALEVVFQNVGGTPSPLFPLRGEAANAGLEHIENTLDAVKGYRGL
jgi:hypothetical protein